MSLTTAEVTRSKTAIRADWVGYIPGLGTLVGLARAIATYVSYRFDRNRYTPIADEEASVKALKKAERKRAWAEIFFGSLFIALYDLLHQTHGNMIKYNEFEG